MLAGAGMPKPLTGAELIQNLLQIAVGESEEKERKEHMIKIKKVNVSKHDDGIDELAQK